MNSAVLAAAGLALAGAAAGAILASPARRPGWQRDNPAQVALGQRVYARNCAGCHGAALQGQPDWRTLGPQGVLPAPPLDESGHGWQHSDADLTELVATSTKWFAAPGYRTAMPAFAGVLSEAEVRAVVTYVKSTWPPGTRAFQAAQNPGGPALTDIPGDWRFPPTCSYPQQP